jgi:hypothetical protein
MNLGDIASPPSIPRHGRADRRVPGWAAALLDRMARDRPAVVTRETLRRYLTEVASARDVESAARELQRLRWIVPLHLMGVWAYLPPGEDTITDSYIDLRGWKERDPTAVFFLAGESTAWHLGYLDRQFTGPVAVWIPVGARLPHGLRAHLSIVRIDWPTGAYRGLGPTPGLLRGRGLDLTRWASGLPAIGPEALVVQLAPLASDCDVERLANLLRGQSSSAWQRAAYLLHCGKNHTAAINVLDRRPRPQMAKAQFGTGPSGLWVPEFGLMDHLIAPLEGIVGKA